MIRFIPPVKGRRHQSLNHALYDRKQTALPTPQKAFRRPLLSINLFVPTSSTVRMTRCDLADHAGDWPESMIWNWNWGSTNGDRAVVKVFTEEAWSHSSRVERSDIVSQSQGRDIMVDRCAQVILHQSCLPSISYYISICLARKGQRLQDIW